MVVDGQRHAPTSLPPGKRAGTHSTGSWVMLCVLCNGCRRSAGRRHVTWM